MEKLRLKFDGRLTTDEITKIVDTYKNEVVPEVLLREEYARGNNPTILHRQLPASSPQNKVPQPYGRRITSIVSSYMYLPGLINYASENQAYLDQLTELFELNEEPVESYRLGWQSTVQGLGYELFWVEGVGETTTIIDGRPGFEGTVPHFDRIPVAETIPIYDLAIVPVMQAFIHFYMESEDVEIVQVYYFDEVVTYRRSGNNPIAQLNAQPHGFDRPPLVVYENNDDLIGDFSSVIPLIDSYDVLTSDSMNEFDRFAHAYLIFKGMALSEDDAEMVKYKRAFNLTNPEDSVSFLTKPIEVEFIRFMSEHIRAEIHRGSGIPNLDDFKWGGSASGETIGKFIYLMELFTGGKEPSFKRALTQRIAMLTAYGNLSGTPDEVQVIMTRNDPDKSLLQAELLTKYAGHVSERTLLANFADFIDDVDSEMELLAQEKVDAPIDLDVIPDADPDEEDDDEMED